MSLATTRTLALAAALVGAASPCAAATLPAPDLPDDANSYSLGPISASLDVPIWDNLTAGAFASYTWFMPAWLAGGGARLTYRLGGSANGPAWGVSLAGGYTHLGFFGAEQYTWAQPALVATLPLGDSNLWLRGAIGPAFYVRRTDQGEGFNLFPVPNLELAYRYRPGLELVFGGGDLVSLRGTF